MYPLPFCLTPFLLAPFPFFLSTLPFSLIYSNTNTNNGKTSTPPLLDWQEVPQHPGLVSALTSGGNHPVVLLVKPDCLLIHELKPLPSKSKIQGAVMVKHNSDFVSSTVLFILIMCISFSLSLHELHLFLYQMMAVYVSNIVIIVRQSSIGSDHSINHLLHWPTSLLNPQRNQLE